MTLIQFETLWTQQANDRMITVQFSLSCDFRSIYKFLARVIFGVIAFSGWSESAFAYRPFDGTDAGTADLHEIELEMQPIGAQWNRDSRFIDPQMVFNYGFAENWELVLQTYGNVPLWPKAGAFLESNQVTVKHVLREGVLQDKEGISIATEFGLLFPDSTSTYGMGATLAGIVSNRWDWGAIHFNVMTNLTPDQHFEAYAGPIIEGPAQWVVRPVAEVYYDRTFNQSTTVSGLVGLIWQVNEKLAVDLAFRHAWTNDHPFNEVRAGLTYGFVPAFFGKHQPADTIN